MKCIFRRTAALLFTTLLVAQMVCIPVAAGNSIYFTAINDTVLPLSDSTMPFWSEGYLYVSSSTFSDNGLGLYYSGNTITQKVVLCTYGKALIFHLNTGTVTDNNYNDYWPPAVVRGSQVFLPVSLVAEYFGFTYSYSRVEHGYLVRVRNSESVLKDSTFIDAAHSQLTSRYSRYLKSKTTTTQIQTKTTQIPTVSKNKETKAKIEKEENPEIKGKTVHLCFQAGNTDRTAEVLNVLKKSGDTATIYFTKNQIQNHGNLVRQAVACGQSVGLAVNTSAQSTVKQQLDAANNALFDAASLKTRLYIVKSGSGTARKTVQVDGYCCLTPEIDRSSSGLQDSGSADSLLRQVTAHNGAVTVWLSDHVYAAGLRAFISAAKAAGDGLTGLTELTA